MAPERAPTAARSWPLLLAGVAVALLVVLAILHETAAVVPPLTPAARAHAIGERLACPICHGETVADSPSVLAQQMRGIIADQIAQGRSDVQITQYFVDRYGQGILLAPPAHGFSLLAWLLPIALLVFGGGGIALAAVRWSRRGGADALPALTPEEQAHYGALLAQRLREAEAAEQADRDAVDGASLSNRVGAAPRGRPTGVAHAADDGDGPGRPRGAAHTSNGAFIARQVACSKTKGSVTTATSRSITGEAGANAAPQHEAGPSAC